MTTNHEAVAALPVGSNADKAAERALLVRRYAYCLAASESAVDFVAVDPDAGTVPLYLIQNGTVYEYDSLDSTTAASATCLITSEGKRYKSGPIDYPWSVLTVGTTAQPTSPAPAVGDRYLVPTAATGTDWAGKDGKVAIYTAAGWQFATVPVGRGLYAEDTNIRWYRNAAGTWTSGIGAVSIGAGGINITQILGAKASFVIKVENQTTTAPPASPVAPVAYIIGPSATDAWAGNDSKLAICLTDGTFTIITPTTGDSVYDKALSHSVEWNGTAWISATGAFVAISEPSFTSGTGSTTATGSGVYTYSDSTGPVTTQYRRDDNVSITYAAKRAGANLFFKYQATIVTNGSVVKFVGAIRRGNETTTLSHSLVAFSYSDPEMKDFTFVIGAADTAATTYKFGLWITDGGQNVLSLSRRLFYVMEAS